MTDRLKLKTQSFGTLEYEPQSVIHIQEGMLGFSRDRNYLLIENGEIHPFKWLQSLDNPYVSFPVIDPQIILHDYSLSISAEDRQNLEIESRDQVVSLVVAVIPDDPTLATVNLRAPVVINHRRMLGKQIILAESNYDTQQALTPE